MSDTEKKTTKSNSKSSSSKKTSTRKKTTKNNNDYLRNTGSPVKEKKGRGLSLGVSFVVVILLMIGAWFGLKAKNTIETEWQTVQDSFNIPSAINLEDGNLTLPTASGSFSLLWLSGDTDYLTDNGKVRHPDYEEGDQVVSLSVTPTVITPSILLSIFKPNLQSVSYSITIYAEAPTAEHTMNVILAKMNMPAETASSIGLANEFPGMDVTAIWSSSDEAIMTDTGEKVGNGLVTMTLTLRAGDLSKSESYEINCLDSLTIDEVMIDFDSDNPSSSYKDYTSSSYSYHNGRIIDSSDDQTEDSLDTLSHASLYLRTENNDDSYLLINSSVLKASCLSFDYQVLDTHKTYTKTAQLIIYNGETIFDTITFKTEADEVGTYVNSHLNCDFSDIISAIQAIIPGHITSDLVLPLTTIYGGIVSITPSDTTIVETDGTIHQKDTNQEVSFNVNVTGLTVEPFNYTLTVTVMGLASGDAIYIRFIDLGKYGGSDCGESTLISYNNIDILVDSGDNITESKQSVKEALQTYVTDGVVEYLIATHPDSDHIGGMVNVYNTVQVNNTIVFEGSATSNNYKNFLASYTSEPNSSYHTILEYINSQNGLSPVLQLASNLSLTFFNTGYLTDSSANGRSIVFRLDAYNNHILFTGDADNNGRTLESNYMNDVGNIDILKVVHHGTQNGTTLDFLKAIDPEVAIICNGNYLGNKYGHPTPQAINNLYEYDNAMYVYAITGGESDECEVTSSGSYKCSQNDRMVDRNGLITITINNTGYNITSEYGLKEMSDTTFWNNCPLREYRRIDSSKLGC